MADDGETEDKFWEALRNSPFIMLGIEGASGGATQPMTVNFDDEHRHESVLWIFTAKDHDLTRAMAQSNRAFGTYCSKAHDLFASLRGNLRIDNDRAIIDRLWSPMVAEWYEGKDDPKMALIRFEIEDAKVWLSNVEGFLTPMVNKLIGRKPEAGMKQNVAELSLS